MKSIDDWQLRNDDYLAKAVAWVRLRLIQQAQCYATAEAPRAETPSPRPERGLAHLLGSRTGTSSPPPAASGDAIRDGAQAEAEMRAGEQADPPPGLCIVGKRLGLSQFERDVLLLCAAMELDTRVAGLCARAQDDPSRPYPTFALALSIFDDPTWDVLSPQRPLRFWRLLEISQPGAQPLTTSALRADERIVNCIKGLNYLDDRITPLLVPFDANDDLDGLPESHWIVLDRITRQLRQAAALNQPPIIQLVGADAPTKQLIAWRAAGTVGLHVYRLPLAALPAAPAEIETFARLWQRESLLSPIALYLDAHDVDPSTPEGQVGVLSRFLTRVGGVVFVDTRELLSVMPPHTLALDVSKPAPGEQSATWTAALGPEHAATAARLAAQFNLSVPTIRRIARTAHAESTAGSAPSPEQVWQTCVFHTRPRLDLLAQRLEPKATWDTIVLPAEETELLLAICEQVRQRQMVYEKWGFHARMNRGLGVSALFAGDSGTGKTMAAEVIANDLQLNLYRIDLSAVVSKYIGETEKNLRRVFDAGDEGGAILFFDEADALFGKRSEVKDSHDRYANIEINYLLQRMEVYRGVAIMATNMKSALDSAFVRRLRFIVNFPSPSTAERRAIWEKVFPPQTPVADLDLDRLARLNLTGGSIHNIALHAAFLAARAGSAVTMPLVLNAARAEFRKLERPIHEPEFRYLETAGANG